MPHITHRGCRLFWERDGRRDAPPLLLVRGLGRSMRYWGALRDRLGRDFHLLLTDNRGVGRSDAPWPPYSTPLMADDHAAILDAAGIGRTHVFGMSLGGMIAQQLAIRHPARVDRLILGCTTPGGPHSVRSSRRDVIALMRASIGSGPRALRRMAPRLLSAGTLRERPQIVDEWIAIAASEPRRRRGTIGQLLAGGSHDAWDQLPRVGAPTLVVTGDADRLIDPTNSRLLAERIPGARFTAIGSAGHDFAAERPEETAAIIAGFLAAGA